jgi:hypothetical protein
VEHFLRLLRKEEDAGGVVSSGAQRGVLDDLSLAYEVSYNEVLSLHESNWLAARTI